MDIKKNLTVEIEITGMTAEGNGVGRYEGTVIFVPSAAVGDRISCRIVKVCKNFCYGKIEDIISPSPDRTAETGCEVYSKCGGCIFRHIGYDAELRIKENIVRDAFRRIGGLEPEFESILGCERTSRYRNKAQYPVAFADGKAVCGFYAPRSHRVIPCGDCDLQPEIFSEITAEILKYINDKKITVYDENTKKGNIRHIYLRRGEHSGEIMACIVAAKKNKKIFSELGELLTVKFPDIKSFVLNVNPDNTNVILGRENIIICGKDHIEDTMCGNRIKISPLSFYQVNTLQAERLYETARDLAGSEGCGTLLDLYCGAGTVGLSFSDDTEKLIGCEIIPEAVENARENARLDNIPNAEFICGDAAKVSETLAERGLAPDIIVTDPPRKGCDERTLLSVIKMAPSKIVMISCNPATAARDCAFLEAHGYKAVKVKAVDMFPRTGHVECVVLLSPEKP